MISNIKFPIAETFTSIHGEGRFAGTRMTFFRLAGCTVGKYKATRTSANLKTPMEPLMPILPSGKEAWECTAFDGRTFPCDTDFNKYESLTTAELTSRIPKGVTHVCITGGEPLMHKGLITFVEHIHKLRPDIIIHIETSGTIVIDDWLVDNYIYIACSPKQGCLPSSLIKAGEIRLMVDENFAALPAQVMLAEAQVMVYPKRLTAQIYLAPLSLSLDVTKIDPNAMKRCFELLEQFPEARISIQMHKILGVR